MKVRTAVLDDLSSLVKLTVREAEEAEGATADPRVLESGIKKALLDESLARYWVLADEAGTVHGSISALREWSDWNAGFYWWIQSLYIVPEERGKGNFISLLEAVSTEMQRQGGLELRLYVHRHNRRALRAYEKAGFQESPYQIMTLNREL